MGLVIAIFIITAVYVGYHASQDLSTETVKIHGKIIELDLFGNQIQKTAQVFHIKTDPVKSA